MALIRNNALRPRILIVGGGYLGFVTAQNLLKDLGRGEATVTVVDRDEVGSGASWGNAGWVSPGLALPLTSPHVLGEGLRGLFDPRAPLSVPARPDPRLWHFLLRFAAHCTTRQLPNSLAGSPGSTTTYWQLARWDCSANSAVMPVSWAALAA